MSCSVTVIVSLNLSIVVESYIVSAFNYDVVVTLVLIIGLNLMVIVDFAGISNCILTVILLYVVFYVLSSE